MERGFSRCWVVLWGLPSAALGARPGAIACVSPALPGSGSRAPRGALAAAEVSCAGKRPPGAALGQAMGLGEPGGCPSRGAWAFLPPLPSPLLPGTASDRGLSAFCSVQHPLAAPAPGTGSSSSARPQLSPSRRGAQRWPRRQSTAAPSAAMLGRALPSCSHANTGSAWAASCAGQKGHQIAHSAEH